MKKITLKKLMITAIILLFSVPVFSQDEDPPPEACDECPIDGGISILVAAGAIVGIKKRLSYNQRSL